jgi:integrase
MANRVQSLLKRLFTWSLEREIIDVNPLLGLRPPAKERSRARLLDDDELARIWRAAGEVGWPYGPITRLLALTGARRREVGGLAWSELDLERATWVKPSARTKSGKEHTVPLSGPAVDLIRDLPRIDLGTGLVFPARSGGGPVSAFSGAKLRLDAASGVTGWTHHDLRRALASGLAKLGYPPHIIQATLGHSQNAVLGVTAIYQRHRHEREVRAALEAWAQHVLALADGQSKVVPLLHGRK